MTNLIIFSVFFHIMFYSFIWKIIDYQLTLSRYNLTLLDYKRKYVIKNLVKCICLAIWSPLAFFVIKEAILHNQWDNNQLHIVGSFYALNDLLGLVIVKGLPIATKIHHTCVVILGIININTDYNELTVWRACIIYGAFSIIAFPVNGYMGLRYITDKEDIKSRKKLWLTASFSLFVYLCCFTLNWIYHYNFLYSIEKNFNSFIYFTLAHLVMYDDIKLIKHLVKVVFNYI